MEKHKPKTSHYMSPLDVAKTLGVSSFKVRLWIEAGELDALNVATSRTSRPRWRIAQDAFDRFLTGRAATPNPAREPRRRRLPQPTEKYV